MLSGALHCGAGRPPTLQLRPASKRALRVINQRAPGEFSLDNKHPGRARRPVARKQIWRVIDNARPSLLPSKAAPDVFGQMLRFAGLPGLGG